ncbi:hypothetical protein AOZ06_04235 [Kibdelosporangium phytohabitans]|uniref:Uncharacterized protein n=1 Tax=Kibdelosporangium phytohabitans TaxID=860235 RepID=A0A0N9HWL9_9PSEU|nr:hypothetical protein AOZ06_04235 [Kibdelosporangium phytohabitans]
MLGGGGIANASSQLEATISPATDVIQQDDGQLDPRIEKILNHNETVAAHVAYKAGEASACDFLKKKYGTLAKAACKKLYEAAAVLKDAPAKNQCLRGSSTSHEPYVKFQYVQCK